MSFLFFFSLSLGKNLVAEGSNFPSSTSTEELTLPISEVADSGRGSWTSCSSNSHDNFQHFQVQRMSDMNQRNAQKADTIPEVDDLQAVNRHFRDGSEPSHSTKSWTSSSSVSDRYEGNCSTVKCREKISEQSTDPTYKTVTSTTEKGLIGEEQITRLCVDVPLQMATAESKLNLSSNFLPDICTKSPKCKKLRKKWSHYRCRTPADCRTFFSTTYHHVIFHACFLAETVFSVKKHLLISAHLKFSPKKLVF